MTITNKHPSWEQWAEDWQLMRDARRSTRAIKDGNFAYLPATDGERHNGALNKKGTGWDAYEARKARARVEDWVDEAIEDLLGVMHRKPPVIELPAKLEPLRDRATRRNESLAMLLQRINEEQIHMGRIGLMGDVIDTPGSPRRNQPFIATYCAESITNWDEGLAGDQDVASLNLVVLDESGHERQANLSWDWVDRYRLLVLGDLEPNEAIAFYRVAELVGKEPGIADADFVDPTLSGVRFQEIPFVIVNSRDVTPEIDKPPLLGLANLLVSNYQTDADYRQSLFMQGQDTLVTIGANFQPEDVVRQGAGARIDIPMGGDCKMVGSDSTGLPEQRAAIEADQKRAKQLQRGLADSTSREKESGDALRIRVNSRAASLHQIALTGAFGLQEILRKIARWAGANEDQVTVTPNLDFVDDETSGKDLMELVMARRAGAPLSMHSIHTFMQRRSLTDLSLEDEVEKMEEEKPLVDRIEAAVTSEGGAGESTNPDGPEPNDDDDGPDDDEA